jgi:hypothetical protein
MNHPKNHPKITDLIVPRSIRVRVTHYEDTMMTIRCGRCGHEQEVFADCHTSRCKGCGRVCQLDRAIEPGANVTPIRRRA